MFSRSSKLTFIELTKSEIFIASLHVSFKNTLILNALLWEFVLLLELETLKEQAIADNDKRIWLEVLKYQNKIRGGEIERQEIKVQGEVKLSWGAEISELDPNYGQTEIL